MKEQDFKTEAALRMLTTHPEMTMEEVADNVYRLTELMFPTPEPEPEPERPPYTETSITEVYEAMKKKADEEYREKRKDRGKYASPANTPGKFLRACQRENINTVGELLDMGYRRFLDLDKVGHRCIDDITDALLSLYGVKW